jgi:hypothetical protein
MEVTSIWLGMHVKKSTGGGLTKWNTIFNIIIENNNLFDIKLNNRKYTWCKNHVDPFLLNWIGV